MPNAAQEIQREVDEIQRLQELMGIRATSRQPKSVAKEGPSHRYRR